MPCLIAFGLQISQPCGYLTLTETELQVTLPSVAAFDELQGLEL